MDTRAEEAICDLQAQVCVMRVVLRSLIRSHPEPALLLDNWREALAEVNAAPPPVPAYARRSEYLAERCQAFAEDWTAELVDLTLPRVSPI